MAEVVLDALLDTLKISWVLLIIHVLIELLEYKATGKIKMHKVLRGGFAPLIGTGVGVIPQCGFSVVATNLYAHRHITVGTLLAVYIATSDEAIPILLSSPATALKLVPLIIVKVIFALIVGYGATLIFRKKNRKTEEFAEGEIVAEKGCHGHEIGDHDKSTKKELVERFVWHPLLHTLTVCLYIFIVNLALGIVIYYVGEERLMNFMENTSLFQPFLAGLVGLIPNCASSVAITQFYAMGGLTLGSAVAGLSVNAGLGFAVLFKENKNIKENLLIVAALYGLSTLLGLVVTLLGF